MNITKSVVERNRALKEQIDKEKQAKESIGINSYKRLIAIYPSISKNINNIDGHNILLTSRCILINYSVSKMKELKENNILFNKTTYICDLNFPGNITPKMLMANDISSILKEAVIEPIYAFNNPHFESDSSDNFVDFGLTMVDLNTPCDYGVINFSGKDKDEQYSKFYHDIVNPEFFNPKYYIPDEKEIFNNGLSKSGPLIDFIDNHTSVVKDIQNYKRNIKLYKNGIEKRERVINTRTMKTNELLLDIFSDLIFIPIEDLDMIIDVSQTTTIKFNKFTTFIRFNRDANSYYLNKVSNSITKTINLFRNKINGENFYITLSKNEVLFSLNIAFKNKDNSVDEIRIMNPIHKLYSQFALNNESIVNNIENDAEYTKMNYIEAYYDNPDRKLIQSAIKTVDECSRFLDTYKTELLLGHYNNKQMLQDYNHLMIEDN